MTNPNNLELNKGDNFIFGVDVSGSMETADCPGGLTRIEYLKEKVIAFANEASKYDEDGIDVLAFGHQVTPHANITADNAKEIITKLKANEGATMTHQLINSAYKIHKAGGYAQTVCFVATDGQPSDPDAVLQTIAGITQELKDPKEFKISFLTVGQIDAKLQDFLTKLDDKPESYGAKLDICDVKALESVDFMTAFVGALND